VSAGLRAELESRGIRAIHAAEEELATADARGLLESAIEDECLLVTRNYADLSDLAAAYRHVGREFPGVLFLPSDSLDPAAQADRIAAWLEAGGAESAVNRCEWLV